MKILDLRLDTLQGRLGQFGILFSRWTGDSVGSWDNLDLRQPWRQTGTPIGNSWSSLHQGGLGQWYPLEVEWNCDAISNWPWLTAVPLEGPMRSYSNLKVWKVLLRGMSDPFRTADRTPTGTHSFEQKNRCLKVVKNFINISLFVTKKK